MFQIDYQQKFPLAASDKHSPPSTKSTLFPASSWSFNFVRVRSPDLVLIVCHYQPFGSGKIQAVNKKSKFCIAFCILVSSLENLTSIFHNSLYKRLYMLLYIFIDIGLNTYWGERHRHCHIVVSIWHENTHFWFDLLEGQLVLTEKFSGCWWPIIWIIRQ